MNSEDLIFETCKNINTLLLENREEEARDNVIKLLDYHSKTNIEYSPLVNHLIREVGLYPYMKGQILWEDGLIYDIFKAF